MAPGVNDTAYFLYCCIRRLSEMAVYFIYQTFFMNIFIARLSYDTNSDDLQEVFEEFGEVSSSKVIMDYDTGRSKGFGFVEMENEEAALDAIHELDDTELHGRSIVVKKARPRSSKPSNSYNRW